MTITVGFCQEDFKRVQEILGINLSDTEGLEAKIAEQLQAAADDLILELLEYED